MRAFLGIYLPDDVRASLAGLQRELAASRADVKWVEPSNLHVTLKFLDEITDGERRAVDALLTRVAMQEAPFALGLQGVGAFPSIQSPRVVWVGLGEGRDVVARLVLTIEGEGAAIALRREERPFSPHLTLGRVRSPRHRQELVQRLRDTAWQPPRPWPVASLTLYQSVLTPAGPTYSVLAEVSLAGKAPTGI